MNHSESPQPPKRSDPTHVELLSLKFWVIFAAIAATYFFYVYYLSIGKPEAVKASIVTTPKAAQ